MLSKKTIEEIVCKKIETDETLGEQAGGSGHLSNVSFSLDEVESKKLQDDQIQVDYKYTISIETEFTYYPDNPPYTTQFSNTLILDMHGTVLKELGKEIIDSNMDFGDY